MKNETRSVTLKEELKILKKAVKDWEKTLLCKTFEEVYDKELRTWDGLCYYFMGIDSNYGMDSLIDLRKKDKKNSKTHNEFWFKYEDKYDYESIKNNVTVRLKFLKRAVKYVESKIQQNVT